MWQVWAVTFKLQDVHGKLKEATENGLNLVDADSRTQLQRFYRREDTFRGLIGRLLPRVLLKQMGITPHLMTFGATPEGKPYMTVQGLPDPIGYSITHDNGVIAMAFASGDDLHPDPPSHMIGLDIMRLNLPKRHTFTAFVEVFFEQLTVHERALLLPPSPLSEVEGLRRFYLIWTLKEAYTKALGMGLGFDFKRIDYDISTDVVRVDGKVPRGWEFTRFDLIVEGSSETETYVGVAARYFGEDSDTRTECVVEVKQPVSEWLQIYDAVEFLQRAVKGLSRTE